MSRRRSCALCDVLFHPRDRFDGLCAQCRFWMWARATDRDRPGYTYMTEPARGATGTLPRSAPTE